LERNNEVSGTIQIKRLRAVLIDHSFCLQPKGPIIEKKQAPKELGVGGSDLAKAMDELEMAFK
jgi:hypothetical protein